MAVKPILNTNIVSRPSINRGKQTSTKKNNNQWLATGGRVISLSALGSSLKNAKDNVYNTIKKIDWKDSYYRKDIGWRHLWKKIKKNLL